MATIINHLHKYIHKLLTGRMLSEKFKESWDTPVGNSSNECRYQCTL